MEWIELIFSTTVGLIIFLPLAVVIIIFYNKVFWFVGGLLGIKNPFWRLRGGGIVVLIIYTIIIWKMGLY